MRKVLFLVLVIAGAVTAQAQESPKRNALKLNPLSLIFATGNVSFEKAIGETNSMQLGFFYSGVNIGGVKYSGMGFTPEYRFYFKEAMNGIYAAPFLRYQNFKLEDKESANKSTYTSYGGGAIMGWQKMWNSGFTLEVFVGPSYNSGTFKNESDEDVFNLKGGISGFGFRSGLTIGFGF
jgi:hypothetical protein